MSLTPSLSLFFTSSPSLPLISCETQSHGLQQSQVRGTSLPPYVIFSHVVVINNVPPYVNSCQLHHPSKSSSIYLLCQSVLSLLHWDDVISCSPGFDEKGCKALKLQSGTLRGNPY